MIYKCVLCQTDVAIKVYILNSKEPFVCPECLQKKFKSKCSLCNKDITILPMAISKCIDCYKKKFIT
jgi:DNA-directed RNA polymerase subunit RPC12/RpoP